MELFLAILDQLRYITGVLLIVFLLCHKSLPHRARYWARLTIGCAVSVTLALLYIPISRFLEPYSLRHPIAIAPYWLAMSFLPVGFVLFCYETNLASALFRTMMGGFAENIVTVLIRYLFVMILFPSFPLRHTVAYILLMAAVYTAVYAAMYGLVGRRISVDVSDMYQNATSTTVVYMFAYLSYTAILSATKVVCENVITPLNGNAAYTDIYRYLQFFMVADMLLISVVMTVVMWYSYERAFLQNEKQIMLQMAKDRESQYEFSRENIEMINRKSHDLKHQLRALEQVSDEERRKQLRETRKAIDFYDAVVKTGNEALDTILTEKSVYCTNHNIRLSCSVHSDRLGKIGLVDLYTLLGNAIDNAIESTDACTDPEKKIISLSIRETAEMVYIQIENYYEGTIQMRDGIPVTHKADKENHGYGVKSIRAIVQRYNGIIRISTENQVFRLQMVMPI